MAEYETFLIDKNFGYVILVAAAAFLINFWQMLMITRLRKRYGIDYPAMTSAEHEDFNCAQRVHQNTLEFLPFFFTNLLMGGIRYPFYAVGFGCVFLVGRIIYSFGYYTGQPKKRVPGAMIGTFLGLFPLFGLAIASGLSIGTGWF